MTVKFGIRYEPLGKKSFASKDQTVKLKLTVVEKTYADIELLTKQEHTI